MKEQSYKIKEARSLGLTEFRCSYPCTSCARFERKIVDGKVYCVFCTRHGVCLSKAKLTAAQRKHNESVQKRMFQNFSIPTVFSGMNTGTR